jgi:hypothetical protein
MTLHPPHFSVHPLGEPQNAPIFNPQQTVEVETYGGKIHVEWDPQAAVTPLGQLPFFIEFLKTADLFASWVSDAPLCWTSPNAPTKTQVLGTLLLSVLAGHHRYAHIATIRSDAVNPPLLGMETMASEDSVRRSLKQMVEAAAMRWLTPHLKRCYEPLLYEPWILDTDVTVKPVYGHQEGAVLGYNPHKPGRPSHAYHTYFIANLRLILDVEVQAGNKTAFLYTRPGLMSFLDGLPPQARPRFTRGDCACGNEAGMKEFEDRGYDYLFKMKQTSGVKKLIEKLFRRGTWVKAGQGWEGCEGELQLKGWTKKRRVVVLRREIKNDVIIEGKEPKQMALIETADGSKKYEYAVLVTTLQDEILTLAQHYRDRADSENNFDELKNQWGWCGFTTHDLKRCRIMARVIALIYNWWSLFVRLAIPDKHAEAITSRPLLLEAVGKQTVHGRQTTLTLTSTHAKAGKTRELLTVLGAFLREIRTNAEQLGREGIWRKILEKIFQWFLKGRPLAPPPLLPSPA